ncbi:MAG: hypothetical protein AAFN59_10265, partial [Pseudomonadota bacterium]
MRFVLIFSLLLAGCGGLSYNTEVAEQFPVRLAMMASVEPGVTTETAFVTRWGNPTQKVREGAQTEFIYRDTSNPDDDKFRLLRYGTSPHFVIVTFQYGLAVGVRSSDIETCRGTFPPQPPGFGFDTPATVYPMGACATAGQAANITDQSY